jgi:hypothetical protein
MCRGHESLDAAAEMDVKKDILLERFQEEVGRAPFLENSALLTSACSTQDLISEMPPSMAWYDISALHPSRIVLFFYFVLRFLMPQNSWEV